MQFSAFDKIIKGIEAPQEVLHNDDKVIAFTAPDPCAQTHIIVLAKDTNLHSLAHAAK